MDVESLQKSGPRRCSCLVFLVVSVVVLFVAVAAVAAGWVMVVMDLRAVQPPIFDDEAAKRTGQVPYPQSTMNKFAYLRAESSRLENSSAMPWTPVHYGGRTSVGSIFHVERDSLTLRQAGVYFMYIELNFTCTFRCDAAALSVRVGDKLTCEVQLPAVADSTPVTRKCWTVTQLNEQSLQTQMTVPEKGLPFWKLELTGSSFGIFLMD